MTNTTTPAAIRADIPTSATPTAPQSSNTITPTPEQVQALIARGHVRSALPPGPGKRPRGRPRKDGQPPHQSNHAKQSAAVAIAACRHIATHPLDHVGTAAHHLQDMRNNPDNPPGQYANGELMKRIENLKLTTESERARTFLQILSKCSYKDAAKATGASPCSVAMWKHNREFAEIYAEIMKAHDAATIAKTCGTLAALANGEYKPAPDCLPPDMRAASLLMPALDPRFRPSGQTAAQQVQINIQI